MLLALAPLQVASAQATGTLVGQVFDEAGQPLAGVKVTITNIDSGNSVAVQTDGTGWYRRPFLFPGSYRITASKQGFTDNGIDASVPLSSTTEIKPPAITIHPATTAPTTQPTPPPTNQQQPAPVKEINSSLLVNRIDPMRGGNFTGSLLWTLPLGGGNTVRSFDELAFLLPGVAPSPYTPGVRGPGVGFGIGTAGQFSVNGMRARSNNFNVDGSDDNDPDVGVRRQGFVALVPQTPESVQAFQIATLLWNAEFGRNFGSQVNAVSKGGGNAYHGQLYEFFTDSRLNARNTFSTAGRKDPFTRSLTGFLIGGPIGSKRTQFFTSFEHDGMNASTTQHFASPTVLERRFQGAGAFRILNPGEGLTSFTTSRGNSPGGENVLSFYPTPNNPDGPYGKNTYTEVLPSDGHGQIGSFKLTQQIKEKSTFNARYNITDDKRILPSVNQAIRSTVAADTRTQDLSLIYDSSFGPLINEARFSYGRTRLGFSEYPGSPFVFQRSSTVPILVTFPNGSSVIQNFPTQTGPLGEITIEPFSPVGVDVFTFPQDRANNTYQYADTMSWTARTHALKFGADIRRIQLNSRQDRNYRPALVFNPTFKLVTDVNGNVTDFSGIPGTDIANLGVPTAIFQTITAGVPDSTIGLRFTELNFFINDNWRARPNLTVDYGLRYEYNSVPHEKNRRIEKALSLETLPASGVSSIDTPNRTDAFNKAVDAYKRILGGRKGIYEPDFNNFGPHIGFAWDPRSDGKTAIRAGYGIYYDTILGAVVSQSRNVFPNEVPITIDASSFGLNIFQLPNPALQRISRFDAQGNVVASVPVIARGTLNQIGGSAADFVPIVGSLILRGQLQTPDGIFTQSGLAFTLPAKDLPTPYAQQWHLTLERQVLADYVVSAAYIGTKGTKLTRLTTPNGGRNVTILPILDSNASRPTVKDIAHLFFARPEPFLGAFQIFENSAGSNYHAFQLEARKSYSHGYQFTVAYTWSHAIDDVSDVFQIAGAPTLPQGSESANDFIGTNIVSERADANYDVRQRFVASLVWDLPFYRDSNKGAARWLGGWQISSIYQAHTGQPFTINLPFDDNLDGNVSDRPVSAFGLITSRGHGSRRVSVLPRIQTLTDINTFFGESLTDHARIGRNTFRGDNFRNLDLALTKRFRFNENQSLDFRTEMFNSLNRANYGLPVRVLGAPGFGSSYDTVNPARIVQFAMKFNF